MSAGNNFLKSVKQRPGWALLILFFFLLLVVPLLYIPGRALLAQQENWNHLIANLLPRYLGQTLILGIGTALGTGVLGISSAWIMANYQFRGKIFFEILLYLPLAVPAYIMAYAYAGFFEIGGLFTRFVSSFTDVVPNVQIMNMAGLIMIMSLALYPYVYATVRSNFQIQAPSAMEAARSLGASRTRAFWTVALPSARPAAAAGISLVLMETFSEYGAVRYFGVENFTTGIFRAWFTLRDTSLALKLAGLLLLFTFGALAVEKQTRKRKAYNSASAALGTRMPKPLTGVGLVIRLVLLSLPVFLGFVLPVALNVIWSSGPGGGLLAPEFWEITGMTVLIALSASLLIMGTALLINHGAMLFRRTALHILTRLSTLGYAIPGAVLSLAILVFSNGILHLLRDTGIISMQNARMLLINLSFANLMFAYVLRYLAVAYKPLESHYQAIGNSLAEASLSLGRSPLRTLFTINLPLLHIPLFTGGLLVFIDLVKELPMTLILRPFNLETLAVKAYYHSSNEMLSSSGTIFIGPGGGCRCTRRADCRSQT